MKRIDIELQGIVKKDLGDINFSAGSITGEYGSLETGFLNAEGSYDDDEYSYADGCWVKYPRNRDKDKRAKCNEAAKAQKEAKKTEKIGAVTIDSPLSKGCLCLRGTPVYLPPVYAITSKTNRERNRIICRIRKEARVKDDIVPADAVKDNAVDDSKAPQVDSLGNDNSKTRGLEGKTAESGKSKTGLYIGIGVGALIIGGVILFLKRKK